MSSDTREFLSALKGDIHDIKNVLKGDGFGTSGLVDQIKEVRRGQINHEEKDTDRFEKVNRRLVYIAGIGFGVVSTVEFLHYFVK